MLLIEICQSELSTVVFGAWSFVYQSAFPFLPIFLVCNAQLVSLNHEQLSGVPQLSRDFPPLPTKKKLTVRENLNGRSKFINFTTPLTESNWSPRFRPPCLSATPPGMILDM